MGNDLIPMHDAMPQPVRDEGFWDVYLHNRTRIEARWDEESKSFIIEFPRIITCGPTLDRALLTLKSAVKFKAELFLTGEIPQPEEPQSKPVTKLTGIWNVLYRLFDIPANFFRTLWGQY